MLLPIQNQSYNLPGLHHVCLHIYIQKNSSFHLKFKEEALEGRKQQTAKTQIKTGQQVHNWCSEQEKMNGQATAHIFIVRNGYLGFQRVKLRSGRPWH